MGYLRSNPPVEILSCGNDFDKKIVDWLAEQFLETEEVDLRRDRQALQRLMEAAEKLKLSFLASVSRTSTYPLSLQPLTVPNI